MPLNNVAGAGGLLSTTGDLQSWAATLLNPRLQDKVWVGLIRTPGSLRDHWPRSRQSAFDLPRASRGYKSGTRRMTVGDSMMAVSVHENGTRRSMTVSSSCRSVVNMNHRPFLANKVPAFTRSVATAPASISALAKMIALRGSPPSIGW